MTFDINFDKFGDFSERLSERIERATNRIKHLNLDRLEGIHDRMFKRIERGLRRFDAEGFGERIERGMDRIADLWARPATGETIQTVVLEIKAQGNRVRLSLPRQGLALRLPDQAIRALETHGLDWNDIQAILRHDLPTGTILEINAPDLELCLEIQEKPR